MVQTDPVFVKNFAPGPNWLPAVVMEKTGPVSFTAELSHGRVVRRHQDHVRLRTEMNQPTVKSVNSETSRLVVEQEHGQYARDCSAPVRTDIASGSEDISQQNETRTNSFQRLCEILVRMCNLGRN